MPPLSNSLLNREIKVLCKMTGINETVKVVERVGGRELVRLVQRWKDPLTRHTHADGGNYIASMAVSYPATGDASRNEWTWMTPRRETDYNTLITK